VPSGANPQALALYFHAPSGHKVVSPWQFAAQPIAANAVTINAIIVCVIIVFIFPPVILLEPFRPQYLFF
jgi:hypothetical protein